MCWKFFVVVFLVLSFTNSPTLGAFITNDQCKQNEIFLGKPVSISADCICPPNFVTIDGANSDRRRFCILLTEPQQWSNICVSYGCTDDYYEISDEERLIVDNFLRDVNISKFWMSVRREDQVGYPLRKLPGSGWNTPLDFEMQNNREVALQLQEAPGNCLLASLESHGYSKASFDDCNKLHPQLCIHKRNTLLSLSCPAAEFTTRYRDFQDHCFKIVHSPTVDHELKLFNISNHRKLQLLQKLVQKSKLSCKFVVVETFFTQSVSRPRLYFALQDVGVITLVEKFDCVAYESLNFDFESPKLDLSFDRASQRLLLMIANAKSLWRDREKDIGVVCYTDADTELLKQVGFRRRIWPPSDGDRNSARTRGDDVDDKHIYELKLYGDFPELYWCEGHAVPNFTVVKSDKIHASKKEKHVHVYSISLNVQPLEYDRILQKSYLKSIVKQLRDHVKLIANGGDRSVAGRINGMKIVKIESVDIEKKKFALVVHVSVKYRDWDSSDEDDDSPPLEAQKTTLDQLHRLFKEASNDRYEFRGINSTEFCFPDSQDARFSWPLARIGQTVASQNLCLLESTGLPLARKCIGDRIYGGHWEQLTDDGLNCATTVSAGTVKLYNFYANPSSEPVPKVLNEIIETLDSIGTPKLESADVFYLSKAIENIKSTLFNENSTNDTVIGYEKESVYSRLCGILNRVMYVNESILLNSQVALNATNILLDSTDAMINQLSVANSTNSTTGQDVVPLTANNDAPISDGLGVGNKNRMISLNGSLLYRTDRLILLVTDPAVANVTGIALLRDELADDAELPIDQNSFDKYQIRLITADESEADIIKEPGLEIASYIPTVLLENILLLGETVANDTIDTKPFRVVVTVFFNDRIFREVNNGSVSRANSKIISITVPGFGSDLPGELPIFFHDTDTNRTSSCGYWDFNANEVDAMPAWSQRRCYLAEETSDVSLCKCSHLTSFSRLCRDIQYIETVGVSQKFICDQANVVLDVITAIGCTLSLLGVAGIFVTAALFPSWRATANSKILLQLSTAIAIEMFIVFLDGPDIDRDKESSRVQCTLLGAAFHYIILVTFMWMLIIGYLQFMRYIKVLGRLRPSHCILKASILCWCLPLLPVVLFATLDYTHYHKQNNSTDICYPHGPALYFGLTLPISMIILTNATCFLLIIYNVNRIPDNLQRTTDKRLTFSQLRLSSFLFFLLGLPWIFGIMITAGAGSLISYLFCLTAPLQGFILFIYFIIMDPTARKLWSLKLVDYQCSKTDKKNIDMCHK
ncbi:uncharacterized protein LOC129717919 [Wyeomyia smithii]|uniref:uncharacterized protein LOC129717919 n=1 Tax=Wyeomyia smithii TaxID=174621 RepID=UPI002467BBF6|nr:uncharacterized protein LOC129717919 [Wyeomyia smithii]XP_055524192.1 uncharacterized protein LOC129717919 [Wyeomyia smithii]